MLWPRNEAAVGRALVSLAPACFVLDAVAGADLPKWHQWSGLSWSVPEPGLVMQGIWPAKTSGMNFMSSSTETWSM